MNVTATEVCYVCGGVPGSAGVTVCGPPQVALGGGVTAAPILRICRRHVVAKALFAGMNRRARKIVVQTALASRRPAQRDWRPVVRGKVEGQISSPQPLAPSPPLIFARRWTLARCACFWLRWVTRANRAKLARRLLAAILVPRLRQARRRAGRRTAMF